MDLSQLITMSNRYGSDPDLVLAGGGNTSVKDEKTLYVKCSGTQLATIGESGFVPVDRALLGATLEKTYPAADKEREAAFLSDVMASRSLPGEIRRPSVEAPLHNLFLQKYVLHLHPALVNGLTCSKNGKAAAVELFGDAAIWVPVCRPGYTLAKDCRDAMDAYRTKSGRDADILILENHGIFFAADTVPELDRMLTDVMEKLHVAAPKGPDFTPDAEEDAPLAKALCDASGFAFCKHGGYREILDFAGSLESAQPLLAPFTPDHIVYCGAYPTYVTDKADLSPVAKAGKTSKIVLVAGEGYFALGDTQKAADTAAILFDDAVKVAVYARSFGGAQAMPTELVRFITNWEAESYRQTQN